MFRFLNNERIIIEEDQSLDRVRSNFSITPGRVNKIDMFLTNSNEGGD